MTYRTSRTTRAVAVGAALAALASCSPKASAPPAVDTSKDVAAIKAGEAQFNADYKARAVDKIVAGPADLIGYVPFTAVQNGPGDAKAMAAAFKADPALSVTLTADRVEVAKSGDLGYSVGHFERDATNPKTHAVEYGTGGYVSVYRKEADGSWQPIAYAVSPGPPATAPAAKP